MNPLERHIRELIAAQGPISLAAFMNLALQHPEHGYYRRRDPVGRNGDFITAPEVSQLFGEMIGLWCADTWRQMGEPDAFNLVELGPGNGTLMADALRGTARISGFQRGLRLGLLESNSVLQARQSEKLAAYHPSHLDNLDEIEPLPILIIANEFFDALPVRQFEKDFRGWTERMVTILDDRLAFVLRPLTDAEFNLIPPDFHEAVPGTCFEFCPQAQALMRDLARRVGVQGGAALIVDYGYASPSLRPTVQAVSKHQHADVLDRPGEIDLTAHVDFAALVKAARTEKASVYGPIGQGDFLRALGIELRADALRRAAPGKVQDIDSGLKRLTSDMGELFKVIAVAQSSIINPAGFD